MPGWMIRMSRPEPRKIITTALLIGVVVLLMAAAFQQSLEPRVAMLETRVYRVELAVLTEIAPTPSVTFLPTLTPDAAGTSAHQTAFWEVETEIAPLLWTWTPTAELWQIGEAVTLTGMNLRQNCALSAPRAGSIAQGWPITVFINAPVIADGYVWLQVADNTGRCIAWKRADETQVFLEIR